MARPLTVTAYGNAQVDTAVKKNGSGSLLLDGAGDYLTVSQSNGELNVTGAWTIECYFRITDADSDTPELFLISSADYSGTSKVSDGDIVITVRLNDPVPGPGLNDSISAVLANSGKISRSVEDYNLSLSVDTWYHIAVVSNGSNSLKLFLDGILKDEDTNGSSYAINLLHKTGSTNNPLYIGGQEYIGASQELPGYMDELRISNVARYSSNFTPATRFAPDDNTLLLLHMDGADGSTTFTDDIGVQGTAALSSTATLSATANPNPSMVFLGNDVYTWDQTDTWNTIYDSYDAWRVWERSNATGDLTVKATRAIYGSSDILAQFNFTAQGSKLLPTAASILSANAELSAQAQRLPQGRSNLNSQFDLIATAQRLPGGQAILSSESAVTVKAGIVIPASSDFASTSDLTVEGRLVKFAEVQLFDNIDLLANADVSFIAKANLNSEFAQTAKGGLLITLDDPYEYTWDTIDPDTWQGFVRDEWGPEGWFAFDFINLTGRGGLEVNAQSTLSATASLSATANKLLESQADFNAQIDMITVAQRLPGGSANLSVTAELTATALNLDLGSSLQFGEFTQTVKGGIIHEASAQIEDALNFVISGINYRNAGADLAVSAELICGPTLIPNVIIDDLIVTATMTIDGRKFVGGRVDLDAFAATLTVGQRLPGGSASLISEFTVSAFGGSVFNGRADLEAFVANITDSRISNVRGSAQLAGVFTSEFAGDLRLLDSEFIYEILRDTRKYSIDPESRTLDVFSDTRKISVASETRNLDILPENRTIDVAKSLVD